MPTKKTKIGFVILMWNSEQVIEACLRAIFQMQSFETHVVVVDNGSTDDSAEIVKKLRQEIASADNISLELITFDQNYGTTLSRNRGIYNLEPYSPDYYCVLDSDTVVNDEAFLTLVGELEQHPAYGLVGPRMLSRTGSVQSSARAFPTLTEKVCKAIPLSFFQKKGEALECRGAAVDGSATRPVDYLQSACWLMRPELLKQVGYLDENIFYAPEDAEYCIRVWKSGYQVAYCPDAVIVHEWQRLSRRKYFSRLNWEHIKGLAYMFRKHQYLFSARNLRQR